MTILDPKALKDKALEFTSIEFETELAYPENYGKTAGNFDGQGISHGCIQFPLGWGTLQNIWKDLIATDATTVRNCFATQADYDSWYDWLYNKTITQQIAHADSVWTDWANDSSGHTVKLPWRTYFRDLGVTSISIARQQEEAENPYHVNALKWFKDFALWTRRGYALIFDISVQNGSINPIVNGSEVDVMGRIFDRFALLNTTGLTAEEIETEKMKIIVDERAKEVSETWRLSYTERKSSIAQGQFYLTTYGKWVYTEPYNLILEPAFADYQKTDLYVAQEGDTLYTIAQAYNTTQANIELLNPQVSPTNVYAGLSINVPYTETGTVFLGGDAIENIYLGSSLIDKVFLGLTQVFTKPAAPVLPITTISPSNTTQNTIPFTVTLTTDEPGATIYYKLGTGAQQTYTAPFSVNQNSAGVQGTNILITYWAVGAEGTEAEKTITYNTSGAIAGKPSVTATATYRNVALSWAATANTTSYNVYRSTASGTLGTLISQYQTATTYNDPIATAGTYYYTVRASNYGNVNDSDQKSATPTVTFRYLKIEGYGSSADATTRIIEVEAWAGATNTMTAATITSHQAISAGSTDVNTIKDGVKTTTSNTYPLWWATPLPNALVICDLGAQKGITKLNYYSYSISGDQRQNRFKIWGNANGVDWFPIWDMSTNTTPQPILPSGYEKVF